MDGGKYSVVGSEMSRLYSMCKCGKYGKYGLMATRPRTTQLERKGPPCLGWQGNQGSQQLALPAFLLRQSALEFANYEFRCLAGTQFICTAVNSRESATETESKSESVSSKSPLLLVCSHFDLLFFPHLSALVQR